VIHETRPDHPWLRATRRWLIAGAAIVSMIAALPAHAADRGGDPQVVRLTIAVADAPRGSSETAVAELVARVGEMSDGLLVIEPTFGVGDGDQYGYEVGVANLVLQGVYDLALTPSRAWDLAGITSLHALETPSSSTTTRWHSRRGR
jgi:hypothetical protein